MSFDFRRLSGGEFSDKLREYAPNDVVGAYLSNRENGCAYEVSDEEGVVAVVRIHGGSLDCFFAKDSRLAVAEAAFSYTVKSFGITEADVITADSRLVSLCLSLSHKIETAGECYLFARSREREYLPLSCARESDFNSLAALGFVPEHELERLVSGGNVYAAFGADKSCVGFGVIKPCAAFEAGILSAFVESRYRLCGIGGAIFQRLGELCRDYRLNPIAFCRSGDIACEKALESAGFASCEKILRFKLD